MPKVVLSEETKMSRNRVRHLTARNWEVLAKIDETELAPFEKLHTHHAQAREDSPASKPRRPRQEFHRSRFG